MAGQRALLLLAPYGDFTYPYHSVSYVAAALQACGIESHVLDFNALWFRHVFSAATVATWRDEFATALRELEGRAQLDVDDQQRLVDALSALAICSRLQPEKTVDILTSEDFYDWNRYREARRQVRMFEALLSIRYAPYDFLNAFAIPPYEGNAAALVARALRCAPLIDDLALLLERHADDGPYLFCGVSMAYSANLLPGLCLLEAARRVIPGTPRIAGGTAITDVVKYRRDDAAISAFGPTCDAFYFGEAETGAAELVAWCRGEGAPGAQMICPSAPNCEAAGPVPYVALNAGETKRGFRPFDWTAHRPRYDWIDWDLYLAPARRVNLAPVRGCFWNKCTFCDYGLNAESPTAPSRTMTVADTLIQVRELLAQGVDHLYIASDALPPAFLRAFAQSLLDNDLKISWSCQLFVTKSFDDSLVALLDRSGLVIASFGLESGSSSVLERMGKGTNRVDAHLRPALSAFRRSSIGLQPLFFFGFPGENDTDRQATVDFLHDHANVLCTTSKGGLFTLLPGSIMARDPARFGLENLRRPADDDIGGELEYDAASGPASACEVSPFNDQLAHRRIFERPWVGGIDTFHSHLFAARFGRAVFRRLEDDGEVEQILELSIASTFDLEAVLDHVVIAQALASTCETSLAVLPDQASIEEVMAPLERGSTLSRFDLRIRAYQEL